MVFEILVPGEKGTFTPFPIPGSLSIKYSKRVRFVAGEITDESVIVKGL